MPAAAVAVADFSPAGSQPAASGMIASEK